MSVERFDVKNGKIYCYDENGKCTVREFRRDIISRLEKERLEKDIKKLETKISEYKREIDGLYSDIECLDSDEKK